MGLKFINANDKVGPGNPPKHTQFKKGQSGNPKGRPKGSRNLATLVEKQLRKLISVTENGKPRKITIAEAIARRLVSDSLKGNAKSLVLLLKTMAALDEKSQLTEQSSEIVVPDAKALARIQKRLASMLEKGGGDATTHK